MFYLLKFICYEVILADIVLTIGKIINIFKIKPMQVIKQSKFYKYSYYVYA